jgi:hypothetical protein
MASEIPCLSISIAPLQRVGHYILHVTKAPFPSGFVVRESAWSEALTQRWQAWQEMFSTRCVPRVPQVSQVQPQRLPPSFFADEVGVTTEQPIGYAGRLMQDLAISLWQWIFEGEIQVSFNHSQGIAVGQRRPLRLRLELRDPDMIALPWEIMQDGAGKQAISLRRQVLFSRTTSDVHSLPTLRTDHALKVLLVLGHDADPYSDPSQGTHPAKLLKLQQEAETLANVLRQATSSEGLTNHICQVDTLVQPTPAELIHFLETKAYNVLFYAGHGEPAPDGGMLFLQPEMTLNGTELAQVLTRCQVKLAVFNACWGAQPDHYQDGMHPAIVPESKASRAIPRSSLAEVLLHHGVPAVLGMRDSITDEEALSFIQVFARSLAERLPIDEAVAVARQHLLTLYKFNQQAWTLPVLYMHPEYDGELLKPLEGSPTQLPGLTTRIGHAPLASLRSLTTAKVWQIRDGMMRVGRDKSENDLVLRDDQAGASRKHAVIFCRQVNRNDHSETVYYLEDFSRYGTWIFSKDGWHKVHRDEICLDSGYQIKFGSRENEALEFIIHPPREE